jgi:radial spoke head protein 4A
MSSVAELRQILKEDADGKNLYDHLTETLMKILIDRPKNAYDSFELISSDVKSNPIDPNPETGKVLPMSGAQLEKQLKWTSQCEALFKVPDEPPEDSGVKFPTFYPDDKEALELGGVSFGKGELYRLFLSVKKFAESLSAEVEKLRFVGKISTRSTPYYVLEGLATEDEEGIDEFKQEGRSGVNKYTYWVSQNIEAVDWTKLPNVTCDQLVTAAKIKKFLSGNLEAPVSSFPPFSGVEKNLLRAQIARIVSGTCISPDGYFALSEDDPPAVVPAEQEAVNEAFPKQSSDLKEPDAWKHHEIGINKLGRTTALPEQLGEDGEPIVPEEEVEVAPPLDSIVSENWTFRIGPGGAGTSPNSVVVARSTLWPGACAVAYGRKFINIYVGNAICQDNIKKNPDNPSIMEFIAYSPSTPQPIQKEWQPPSEEDGGNPYVEQPDPKVDPTPPVEENAEED